MPLQWTPVHVNFGEGVDTFTDAKAVVTTKLLKAQNVVFSAPGSLRTRYGWELAGSYPNGLRLAHNNGSLIAIDSSRVLPGSSTASTAVSDMAGIEMSPIVREAGYVASDVDCAINGNVMLTATRLPRSLGFAASKITITVTTVDAGRLIQRRDLLVAADSTMPRCVSVGDSIWVFSLLAGALNAIRYHVTVDTFDASILVAAAPCQKYDVCPLSSTDFLLAVQGATLDVFRLSETLTGLAGHSFAIVTTKNLAITGTTAERTYVAYRNDTSGALECSGLDTASMAVIFTGAVIKGVYPTNVGTEPQIVIGRLTSTSAMVIYRDQTATFTDDIEAVTVSNVGVVGAMTPYYRRRILSKPWTQDGVMRLLVGFPDGLQGTSYVMNFGASQFDGIVARNTSGIELLGTIPRVCETSELGIYAAPLLTKQKVVAERVAGQFFYTDESVGVDRLKLDFVSKSRFCTAELGGLTYLAGGLVRVYDGATVGEAGFFLFPGELQFSAVAGGAVTVGDHDYVIIWTYVDARGNVHRSSPSVGSLQTVAPGVQTLNVTFAPLHMSLRESAYSGTPVGHVQGEWYGTLAGSAEPFHRIQRPGDSPFNTPDQEFALTFAAPTTLSDGAISAFPALYTSGGALANFPPPSANVLINHVNRIVLVSAEDGRLWYSKEYIIGEAPGFNDALTFALPTAERPTAMASFDDKLVIWTANEIHLLTGTFPNDTGEGGNLHSQRIASDVGAIDWRSVAVSHQGAFFVSVKGIFLLTRGLAVQFVGADVSYWTDNYSDVTSAIITPDRDEIRFHVRNPVAPIATPTSQTLVLNFRAATADSPFGQWSTFDDALGDTVSAIVVDGAVYRLSSAGTLYRETTAYSDNGAWITVDVETANIYPFGRQAAARVRTATVLGKTEGSHALELQAAYDDEPVFVESAFYTAADLSALRTEQPSKHLVRQKCSGVRLKITTYQDGGDTEVALDGSGNPITRLVPNAGVTLSGIVLEAAQKRGTADRSLPKEARQ